MRIDVEQRITKRDLVIAVWEALDCESIGARELAQIQRQVAERFGAGAVEGPAALARILADEGARLRHPEVLDADAKWRGQKLLKAGVKVELNFSSLAAAAASIADLEGSRREFAQAGDDESQRDLRNLVLRHKQDLLLISSSSVSPAAERNSAREIVGWLEVWLRTPELFADWLELRRAAPGFRKRFAPESDKL